MAFGHLYARESNLTPCPLEGLPKHRVELEPVGTQLSHVKKQKTMGAHPIYMSNARILGRQTRTETSYNSTEFPK